MSGIEVGRRARGVSLIEALVALAVMAFGMLGVVGMQGSMRMNADIAKQRSEAVRIAQEAIESRRAFWLLEVAASQKAYADVVSVPLTTAAGITSNTSFSVAETVSAPPGAGRTKALFVDVTWTDRTGQPQSVRLSTNITGNMPELSGSLGLPALGSPTRLPGGRHARIPIGSVDQGDGTSKFSPPGAGDVSWVFNNVSGFITQTCAATVCTPYNARVLSGYVRFATDTVQPTGAMAEAPTSLAMALNVKVVSTFPVSATIACYEQTLSQYVSYFCAVPVDELLGNIWSGQSLIDMPAISSVKSDPIATNFKVCRYTPVQAHTVVSSSFPNENHPLNYDSVSTALINQNFLVIRAGNGTAPFVCPADDSSTPLIDGDTWWHQPILD